MISVTPSVPVGVELEVVVVSGSSEADGGDDEVNATLLGSFSTSSNEEERPPLSSDADVDLVCRPASASLEYSRNKAVELTEKGWFSHGRRGLSVGK